MKRIMKELLRTLDYAHTLGLFIRVSKVEWVLRDSRMLTDSSATDIKQDNIMIKIRDSSTIDQYLEKHDHSLGEYNFDKASELSEVDVVFWDWGTASWETKLLTKMIQPTLLRAPKVILQAPWGKEVDIWNLGALVPELLEAVRLICGRADITGGIYLVKHHIEEIDALFGPFFSWLDKRRKLYNRSLVQTRKSEILLSVRSRGSRDG